MPNQRVESHTKNNDRFSKTVGQWRVIDQTLVMVGLMLIEATIVHSGYDAEVRHAIMSRVNHLLRKMGVEQ